LSGSSTLVKSISAAINSSQVFISHATRPFNVTVASAAPAAPPADAPST
jgi:hypothetical protein